jgi:hypothetical protein
MRFLALTALVLSLGSALPANAQSSETLACGGTLDGKALIVTRDAATCDWPFDVERMEIHCNGFGANSGDVYFASEKGSYALNGNAKASFDDPRPIWLDDASGYGKVNVGPWIKTGLTLC